MEQDAEVQGVRQARWEPHVSMANTTTGAPVTCKVRVWLRAGTASGRLNIAQGPGQQEGAFVLSNARAIAVSPALPQTRKQERSFS